MKTLISYIPDRQDVVLLNFDPSAGSEIRKRRPALVISTQNFSRVTGLALVCPITHADKNKIRDLGILTPVVGVNGIDGYVNPTQMHTYDFRARKVKKMGELDDASFVQVLIIVRDIIN